MQYPVAVAQLNGIQQIDKFISEREHPPIVAQLNEK